MEKSVRNRFFARIFCALGRGKEFDAIFFALRNTKILHSEDQDVDFLRTHFSYFSEEVFQKIRDFSHSKICNLVASTLDREEISVVLRWDSSYPCMLEEISNPPPLLFVRGKLLSIPLLGIVGPRKYSSYGENMVRKFAPDFIKSGFWIVSWGALGIDSIAHKEAIKQGWYTIAVTGCGIDIDYPASLRSMFEDIVESGGAIVSIFPIGIPALPYHFPIRNEVVVGFSKWIFAPEAGERSGTLITTQLAIEANRLVFTVPGDIGRTNSIGTNRLIRDSLAKPCLTSTDILEEFWIFIQNGKIHSPFSPKISEISSNQSNLFEETGENSSAWKILKILEKENSLSAEAILEYTQLNPGEILTQLALLEISGIIQNTHGIYQKK